MAISKRWLTTCAAVTLSLMSSTATQAQTNFSEPVYSQELAEADQANPEGFPSVADAPLGIGELGAGGLGQADPGVAVPGPQEELSPAVMEEIDRRMMAIKNDWSKFKADAAKPKYPNVQVNGFFQADVGFFDQSANNRATVGDIQDGADFRRFRLSAKGAVIENVNYFAQLDFGFFGRPTFTDVWLEITHVPVLGFIKIGQWKQPFGLETVTSVRYQTFMERSSLFQTFEAFRHIGIGTYNYSESQMSTWAGSVFKTGNDQFGDDIGDNAGISAAARGTHLAWYEEGENSSLYYLHMGGAFWYGNPGNDRMRYATIPEFYIGSFGSSAANPVGTSKVPIPNVANGTPPFVDTGTFACNNFQHYGAELVWSHGPFYVQSEAMLAIVNPQNNLTQMHYKGAYVNASYFLTGESRPYDKKAGALDRVKPLENFRTDTGCGWGAWELCSRYSYIDLNDGNINGGRMDDWTAGVNWYLNPYTKFQANYIKSNLANPTFGHSYANMFGLRAQIDW
ncbi:MAG: phosphate-selective porin [Planctomycetaceae bacterium]|nr:phosphate-selective porin [Planctomycetaceae bacterium]